MADPLASLAVDIPTLLCLPQYRPVCPHPCAPSENSSHAGLEPPAPRTLTFIRDIRLIPGHAGENQGTMCKEKAPAHYLPSDLNGSYWPVKRSPRSQEGGGRGEEAQHVVQKSNNLTTGGMASSEVGHPLVTDTCREKMISFSLGEKDGDTELKVI